MPRFGREASRRHFAKDSERRNFDEMEIGKARCAGPYLPAAKARRVPSQAGGRKLGWSSCLPPAILQHTNKEMFTSRTAPSRILVPILHPTSTSLESPTRLSMEQRTVMGVPAKKKKENPRNHLGRLPTEVFCLVAEDDSLLTRDLAALAATCRLCYTRTNPMLYKRHVQETDGIASKRYHLRMVAQSFTDQGWLQSVQCCGQSSASASAPSRGS